MEPAMGGELVGKGSSTLSWRSRDTSWWTSAVDLSSTLISKMDQVPGSLVGFTLPWHAGGRAETKQSQPQVEEGSQRGGEFAGFWTESLANKPVELPKPKNVEVGAQPLREEVEVSNGGSPQEGTESGHAARRELRVTGESRRRTKRMPVDLSPEGPKQDCEAPIRSKRLSAVSQEFLLGNANPTRMELSPQQLGRARDMTESASIRRVDEASILSSRRSSGRHSSRSLSHAQLLEETIKNNPPHALPQPPGSDGIVHVLRGDASTNGSAKSGVSPSDESRTVGKDPVVGGSYRAMGSSAREAASGTASLPTSPRLNSKESRASKLLRKFKLPGIAPRVGHEIVTKPGKERGSKVSVSQHSKFAKSLEPQKQGITNGVRVPTIQSECIVEGGSDAHASVQSRDSSNGADEEHGTGKKSSSRWLFKWRWGGKPAAKVTILREAPQATREFSPTAEIMSDARDTFCTVSQSDRYSSRGVASSESKKVHRRGSSWGCASLASTAASTPVRTTQRRLYSRIHQDDTMESSLDYRNGDLSFRTCSFRSAGGQSVRKGELVFEDCHGSFRSIASGGSCASFRSVEEIEWDSRLPPPLPADQTLTIGDVAALCNSSLKFVFKCREIHHFNKFLRSQKTRLLEKGDTDCFNVILSGTDIEVSSMVAAMAYAWFLENTVPKVTGETWHAVPVVDMPRHNMHKHKSAAWLFDACGIDPAAVLYADEIDLGMLIAAGRVKTSIIGQDVLVTRNEVGSVCTLFGEKLVAEAQCLLEPRYMKTLLLAGVLLDTENLDFASMRDTEMTTTLLVGSGSLGRNGFFNQLREVEDDDRVSKFITRNYGDGKQLSGRKTGSAALKSKIQQEAEQEQSDKDSLFTQSQDQTSTSEAGTNSSLDEDSPRLKQRSSFKYTKLPPHSAPPRSHQLPSPSSAGCNEDGKAVAHIRKAATQVANSKLPGAGNKSPNFTKIRKKLFLYHA